MAEPNDTTGGAEDCRLDVQQSEGVTHIRFPDRCCDGRAVREMYEASMQALDAGQPKLLFDFTGVDLVPSGAMGMLLTIHKKILSRGGQMHLALPESHVREGFEIAHLDRTLDIYESPDRAREAFD